MRITNALSLAHYEWVSYRRRMRRANNAGVANQGILLLILVLVALKYFQLLSIAAHDTARGNTTLLSALLAGVFLVSIFLTLAAGRAGLAPKMLLHLPLSPLELFALRLLSLLRSPASWLIALGFLALSYPLTRGANPFAGLLAGFLFIIASWQIGFAVSQLLSLKFWRQVFALIAVGVVMGAAAYFRNGFVLETLGETTSSYPGRLVIDAALGRHEVLSLTALSLITAGAVIVAFLSFRLALGNVTTRTGRTKLVRVSMIPGRLGGLIGKDLRYFPRLLDIYLGVLASALGCFHLLVAEFPSADVVRVFSFVAFLMNSALAFNLFGLDDRHGLTRYNLLPLSGRSTLFSKNLAFAITVGVPLLPLLLLTLWRLGLWQGFSVLAIGAASISAYLAWGNWMSITQVEKLTFFRFSSSSRALEDAVGGLIFGSVPCVAAIYAFRSPTRIWLFFLVATLTFMVHFLSLIQFGKRFDYRRESIAHALM